MANGNGWKMAAFGVRTHEYDLLKAEADKRGLSMSALLYALVTNATDNLQAFDKAMPEVMPRGYIKPVVTKELAQ